MVGSKTNNGKRLEVLDIAKGIGILLVVWAHAKGPFSSYIYQFHMPFFFLISGYLYNKVDSLKVFIWKKIQSIYFPFILWNLLGGAIKWIFGLYPYTIDTFIDYCTKVLFTLTKDGQFFGATWFLGSLFVVSVTYKCIDYFIENGKYKRIFLTLVFIFTACVGFSIDFPYMQSRTMVLSMFYAIGVLVREYAEEFKEFNKLVMAVFCFLLFIAGAKYNSANMGANEYTHVLVFVIGALCASYSFIYISQYLVKTKFIKKMLIIFSKYSIDILIWQFAVFRFVIVLQLWVNHLPINTVLEYYPLYSEKHGWWIAYMLVGLFISMLIGWLLRPVLFKVEKILFGSEDEI